MALQNMLAKSSSGVSEIERRVLKAIPDWKKWTRQLKQVYVLLPVFRLRLAHYRDTSSYPIFPGSKKTYIKKSHLDTVYAHESAVLSFMHLERAKASGSAGVNFALKMMASGYLDHMEPINSRPEIKYFMEDQRQPGIVQDNGPAPVADYSGDGLPDL